jgi:hypothetical protein
MWDRVTATIEIAVTFTWSVRSQISLLMSNALLSPSRCHVGQRGSVEQDVGVERATIASIAP